MQCNGPADRAAKGRSNLPDRQFLCIVFFGLVLCPEARYTVPPAVSVDAAAAAAVALPNETVLLVEARSSRGFVAEPSLGVVVAVPALFVVVVCVASVVFFAKAFVPAVL